jgi:hypothetical protein
MGREGHDAGDRKVEAADLQLLHRLGVVRELAGMEHLNLVAALGVLLDLVGEHQRRLLAGPDLGIGMIELQHRGALAAGDVRKAGDRGARTDCLQNSSSARGHWGIPPVFSSLFRFPASSSAASLWPAF